MMNQVLSDFLSNRKLSDLLSNRKQKVVLNSQTSSWVIITAGVDQGSILGSLLFWIYMI